MKKAKYIILHCSGTNVLAFDDINIIKGWHQKRGWRTVGYHFFITSDGQVQHGRKLDEDMVIEKDEVGAHALGFNDESVGICMHGNDFFTPQQFRAQAALIEKLKKQFNLDNSAVIGHNEIPSAKKQGKTCPNYDVARFKKAYLKDDIKKAAHGKGNRGSDTVDEPGNKAGSKRHAGSAQKRPADPGKK
jgi:hypothetical protein